MLERIVGYNEEIYIVSDLNIHLNLEDDLNSRRLTDLFNAFGIVVYNTGPTHDRGNRIDIIASRSDLPLLFVEVFDAGLSDRRLLQWTKSCSYHCFSHSSSVAPTRHHCLVYCAA